MASIAESARIVQGGKVKSAKALKAVVTITCAASTCTNAVTKDGNFCSLPCATTPTEAPMTDHVAPCPDMLTTCIDLECQVRKGIREHLLWNVAHNDRAKASEAALARLNTLLNDGAHGAEAPDFFIERAVAAISESAPLTQTHVQKEKAVLTTTTKSVRKPTTKKVQPRITDNQEHPVTTKITMTKDEMERTINEAVEARIADREATIKATPRVAPTDKPVEIVTKKGGRAKVQRATAQDREHKGLALPAIVVNESLTIPVLEVGEQSLDTLVSAKERRPYNQARYRLDKTPTTLDPEVTTYRALMAEHQRLAIIVAGTPIATKEDMHRATGNPAYAPKVAAKVDATAKATKKAKVAALMEVMGISKAEAKALVG